MTTWQLPLDQTAIERLLPHRAPFLFVDRITELEPGRRIVGVKNVSMDERYLTQSGGEPPALSTAVLIETVAQVGAILVLLRPETRNRLVFFMGIDRVRCRRPVHAGDVVHIEVLARQFRAQMGRFEGIARVNGREVARGTMTFAVGPERP